MSTYATEFEHSDGDDDEMYVNRCVNENSPLMIYMGGGRYGVELWREDVERLTAYLAGVVNKVPERPQPAATWPVAAWHGVPYPDVPAIPTYRFEVVGALLVDPEEGK